MSHTIDDGCGRSEEHTSELQSQSNLVCRLLLEKKTGGAPFPLKARAILLEQLALCRIVHQDQTLRRVQSGYNHVIEISASAGLEGNDQGTSFSQMLV